MNPNEKSERENQEPKKISLVHRVRNEATERHLSESPWCGAGTWCRKTILNDDVSCPACLEIIRFLQVNSIKEAVCKHFAGSAKGKTLCGQWFSHKRAAEEAKTLRETTCSDCLDAAEEILIDLIENSPDLTSQEIDAVEQRVVLEGGVSALRDISETLKELANLWKDEFTAERVSDTAERQPESPAAIDD